MGNWGLGIGHGGLGDKEMGRWGDGETIKYSSFLTPNS
jgi:hypothetical protein